MRRVHTVRVELIIMHVRCEEGFPFKLRNTKLRHRAEAGGSRKVHVERRQYLQEQARTLKASFQRRDDRSYRGVRGICIPLQTVELVIVLFDVTADVDGMPTIPGQKTYYWW